MKKTLSFIFFLAICFLVKAQSDKNVEDGLFKINALLPGVSYEMGVGKNTTLNSEALIGFALNGGSNRDTEFGIFPGMGVEFRYYNNMERRLQKGKVITGNSGNYFGFLNQFQLGTPLIGDLEYSSNYFYNAAAVYGIQRTRPKGFYWSLSFGPGIFVDEYDFGAGLLIDARIGWVLGKRH